MTTPELQWLTARCVYLKAAHELARLVHKISGNPARHFPPDLPATDTIEDIMVELQKVIVPLLEARRKLGQEETYSDLVKIAQLLRVDEGVPNDDRKNHGE